MSEDTQIADIEQQGTSTFYYTAAGYNILLESDIKTEIIGKQTIFLIPHTPDWCQGVISLRGKLIPVANMHWLLGNSEPEKSKWLLVLEKSPFPPIAILIDQLPMQQLLGDEPREATNHEILPHWIQASITISDKVFYDANHTELFDQLVQDGEISLTYEQEKSNPPIKFYQETAYE